MTEAEVLMDPHKAAELIARQKRQLERADERLRDQAAAMSVGVSDLLKYVELTMFEDSFGDRFIEFRSKLPSIILRREAIFAMKDPSNIAAWMEAEARVWARKVLHHLWKVANPVPKVPA